MPLSDDVYGLIVQFGRQRGVTRECLRNLHDALLASPLLTEQINKAVASRYLTNIVPWNGPSSDSVEGAYDVSKRTLYLPLGLLDSSPSTSFSDDRLIMVLGHELQHSLHVEDTVLMNRLLDDETVAIAKSSDYEHDYTSPLGHLISFCRLDEAGAEIAGWNALVSAVRKEAEEQGYPAPGIGDIYRRCPDALGLYVDVDRHQVPPTCSLKTNLEVDADLYMDASTKNLEGIAQLYFDHASGPGHRGDSDYVNDYGASGISFALQADRSHQSSLPGGSDHEVRLDMTRLGLSPCIVAQNGIDLGDDQTPVHYSDRSACPPIHAVFRHTTSSHVYDPSMPLSSVRCEPRLDQESHPDHRLYQQALNAVHRLDAELERRPDDRSEKLAASLVVSARRDRMDDLHHVVLSKDRSTAFGVQETMHTSFRSVTQVDVAQAIRTSVELSSLEWEQAMKRPGAAQSSPARGDLQHPPQRQHPLYR